MKMKNETNTILSKDKTVWDAERALYMLLSDHPHFARSISKVRKQLGIPRDGFADGRRAFEWEHANISNAKKLWSVAEKLIFEFTIKPTFHTEAKFFAKNYIVSPKIVEHQLPLPASLPDFEVEETLKQVGRHKIGARVIQTGDDIEHNKYLFRTRAVYVEITEQTTTRNVASAVALALKRKKDLLPFAMPKTQAAARLAWKLRQQSVSNSKVAIEVNRQFGTRLKAQQVPLYAGRYDDALQRLKMFHSK